jgi:hypothetical protein
MNERQENSRDKEAKLSISKTLLEFGGIFSTVGLVSTIEDLALSKPELAPAGIFVLGIGVCLTAAGIRANK